MRRSTTQPRRACGRQVHPQRAFCSQPALGLIVPGFAQIAWGQGHRGAVFLLTFVSALSTSLLSWGTLPGWGFFGLALFTHLVSSLDVLHQRSFPVFPRVTATGGNVSGNHFVHVPADRRGSRTLCLSRPVRAFDERGVSGQPTCLRRCRAEDG